MLASVLFYSILFFTLVVLPALVILLFLIFVDQERRLWRRFGPVIRPDAASVLARPFIRKLRERYPRTVTFIARRFVPRDPWGLPATVAAIAIFAGVWFFVGIVQDLVGKDLLVTLDVRLHNSVPLFRSTGMTWFMLAVTEAGSPIFLWLGCIGGALIALSRGNRRLAVTLILAIAGSNLISVILKAAFGYARPGNAIIAAHEASFPSGHMLSGAVVYGLLASLILRLDIHRARSAFAVAFLVLFIAVIGVSRIYLGVHWPSDVLGSLALALICLAPLLFFLHYEREIPRIDRFTPPLSGGALRAFGLGAIIIAVAAGGFLMRKTKMVEVGPPPPAHPVPGERLLIGLPADIPRRAEGLVGEKMEPVSIVLLGSADEAIATFTRAGWTEADLPTPIRVMKESLAAITNQPDPSGPATPAYLADRPQTLTFEKPDPSYPGIRHRHHTRVWQTRYCAEPGCRPLWVATASFDVGIELSSTLHLPTHRIDPDIDKERALIASDLSRAGATDRGMIVVVPPLKGTNAAGDAFSTDGRAAVLALPFRTR